jgi:hypothetical protein
MFALVEFEPQLSLAQVTRFLETGSLVGSSRFACGFSVSFMFHLFRPSELGDVHSSGLIVLLA